jgi:hypothetical protein
MDDPIYPSFTRRRLSDEEALAAVPAEIAQGERRRLERLAALRAALA